MKAIVDGDQLCITANDFVNLQESPALFILLDSELAKAILREGNDHYCIVVNGKTVYTCFQYDEAKMCCETLYNMLVSVVGYKSIAPEGVPIWGLMRRKSSYITIEIQKR